MSSGGQYLPQEIIRRKRDGFVLEEDAITFMVNGIADGSVTEGQAAAFAMAVYFKGMNPAERVALTLSMTRSGDVLDWRALNLDGPILDKHSTGGVGDKISLMLAPIVAACGGYVPMISGRGLGHTGGTLDKLDSIPGYTTAPDLETFRRVVAKAGCAIIGQTADLAPADRRLYGIRDVTATVESIPLITASILSKKLAAGLDALCMDVKFGSGAFASTREDAIELARSIVSVGNGAGMKTTALLTDMNQVLGQSAGNGLEVAEAVAYLAGSRAHARLDEVTRALCVELLTLGGLAVDEADAGAKVEQALASGQAAEMFGRMVKALGGPGDFMERPEHYLPTVPVTKSVLPAQGGVVAAMDVRQIGLAVVMLGGGRLRADQAVDHGVGLSEVVGLGETVGPDRPVAIVHARDEAAAERAVATVLGAVQLGEAPPEAGPAAPAGPVVAQRLSEDDL